MTEQGRPITIGQKDSAKFAVALVAVLADVLLVMLGIAGIAAGRPVYPARVVGIVVLVLLAITAVSLFMWRLARLRLEFSQSGIVEVGILGRRHIPLADVRRIDAVDGGTLRPTVVGADGVRLYLPVVRLRVAPGDLPVRQLAEFTMKDAEVNADSLRWVLDRAARPNRPMDSTAKPRLPWRDDDK